MKDQMLPLIEALQRRTLALFIGADLPREVTGLPSRADLARELARRKGLDQSLSLAEVAQRVGQAGNRWEFTAFVRDSLDTAGKSPQPFHRRIVALVKEHQIETIITTAYDNLLELAFQQAGVGINRLVRGGDVSFINPDRPTLIKLYGDAQQPDTLVVTDRDHSDLLRNLDKEPLLDEVRRALRLNTVLFLGYNLADPDFRFLFDHVAGSRFARTAYGVWPGLPEADVQMWRDRGIVILDTDPLGILGEAVAQPRPHSRPEATVVVPGGAQRLAWDTATIRQLLTAAFDDEELTTLCFDYFPPVYQDFGSGMSKGQKTQRLLDYCERHDQLETLLGQVEERNPAQYARFAPALRQEPSVATSPPSTSDYSDARRESKSAPALSALPLYRDFEVLIGDRRGRGYPVHVVASPAGEGEGNFESPFAEDELQAALARLECFDSDESFLADFGARLFAALFTGDVRARYAESVGLTGQDAGLRIRLRLGPPELQELPWELVRDPEKREFLVLSKRALVTRYLHVPRPTPPLGVEPPLRVLVAVAAPRNQVPLDVDDEVRRIRQALCSLLDEGTVEITVEPHVTKRTLRQRLLDDGPHVMHYIGHGDLDSRHGVLLLEDERGGTDPLDGPTLGTLLKGGSVRLAVLNACLSARASSPPRSVGTEGGPSSLHKLGGTEGGLDAPGFRGRRAAFLGVGPALVDAGLGAVVAMQFSVADESARVFAEDFYAMLARFKPVDTCVSRAREALLLEVGLDRRDWATPVLFMRAPDGVLFR